MSFCGIMRDDICKYRCYVVIKIMAKVLLRYYITKQMRFPGLDLLQGDSSPPHNVATWQLWHTQTGYTNLFDIMLSLLINIQEMEHHHLLEAGQPWNWQLDVCEAKRLHDDVIKWKHFPRYWPFVRGIHRFRWIPYTKASDAELRCSYDMRRIKGLNKQSWGWWF